MYSRIIKRASAPRNQSQTTFQKKQTRNNKSSKEMPVPSCICCKQAQKIQENQVELQLKNASIDTIHLEE